MLDDRSATRNGWLDRLRSWFTDPPRPDFACAVTSHGVAAGRWRRQGQGFEAFAARELPGTALRPSPLVENVLDATAFEQVLSDVLQATCGGQRSLALAVPDLAVRVFVLHFDSLPEKVEDALALLRWRLKKSLPFDVEEALLSYQPQRNPSGGLEVILAVAQRRILRRYEELVGALGFQPGVVLPGTVALLPLVADAQNDGGTLVAHLSGGALTTAIVKNGVLYFYRSVESPFTDVVVGPQAFFDELYPSLVYFQDTWGSAVRRVVLAGVEDGVAEIRRLVEREAGCSLVSLNWERWLPARASSAERRDIGRFGLPLLGLMVGS